MTVNDITFPTKKGTWRKLHILLRYIRISFSPRIKSAFLQRYVTPGQGRSPHLSGSAATADTAKFLRHASASHDQPCPTARHHDPCGASYLLLVPQPHRSSSPQEGEKPLGLSAPKSWHVTCRVKGAGCPVHCFWESAN